jgi:hypothetical protein
MCGRVRLALAPAEDLLALDANVELEQLLELAAADLVGGEEADPHAVLARGRQLEPAGHPEESVGDLDEDPGAVAGFGVGALGAAVLEVVQRRQRLVDHVVARLVVEPGDHRDAAGVVLVGGVVQTVGLWRLAVVVHASAPGAAARCTRGGMLDCTGPRRAREGPSGTRIRSRFC